MTISFSESKVILVEVNNYSQGKTSCLKQSASGENIPSATAILSLCLSLGLCHHTTQTRAFCVSLCRDLINHEGA